MRRRSSARDPEARSEERVAHQAAYKQSGARRSVRAEESVAHRRKHQQPGKDVGGWALPAAAMRLPLRRRDPALRRWLERQAADILARLPADGDVRDEVRNVLSTQLTAGTCA